LTTFWAFAAKFVRYSTETQTVDYRNTPHGSTGFCSELGAGSVSSASSRLVGPTHARHLLPAPAQDPHVLWHDGHYYYCESSAHGIFVRSVKHFLQLGAAESRQVWAPPGRGPVSQNLWAPELHRIDGRFYIYFAADNGINANHRMWVLAASTDDPAGPYQLAGSLETRGWAIDGTVLTDVFGNHTFIWSGWAGANNGRQNLYMARMKSPLELIGPRVLLAQPDRPWECHGMPICEGPQVLQRGSRTFIVYSASGSWTEDYCLGLLAQEGGDLMNPSSWRKVGPALRKNAHAWGVGHGCFVTTPDGADDWVIYHAKTSKRDGWADREVRAQPFTWTADGRPEFGSPLPVERAPALPIMDIPFVAQSA
jgi:GH43 family beta-xylosidase